MQSGNSDGETDEWAEIDRIIDTDIPPKEDLILDFYLKDKMLDCMKFYMSISLHRTPKKAKWIWKKEGKIPVYIMKADRSEDVSYLLKCKTKSFLKYET